MKPRNAIVAPSLAKSSTDSEEPKREMPKTANVDPSRKKPRKAMEAPILMQSRTDNEEPKRDIPYTDIVEPMRR
jgi:hypothetical protein